ncbi:PAAR domain-containing protein, partial [Klebsiella pneumoniae]|nr:PAAR domain-containing protein [Klebsiella pneumoniae]
SVAEQEGQQTETEATGAPQKHHYTLNQQVGSITDKVSCPIPGHGTNAIIEGSPEWSSDGKAIVVDGCKCQCGCQVISGAPECAIG